MWRRVDATHFMSSKELDSRAELRRFNLTIPACLREGRTATSYDEKLAAAQWIAGYAVRVMRWEIAVNQFWGDETVDACEAMLRLAGVDVD